MYYSRLKLIVQPPINLKDLRYKFIAIDGDIKKRTEFLGVIDENGLTKWYSILNSNIQLTYEIYIRGELLQTISAKPYPHQKKQSIFTLKTTTELTQKVKNNVKEIYLDEGVIGWYLVKQNETMLDWSKRIFKKPLVSSDWDVLKANNPHLQHLAPMTIITPGQVIILCNTTTAKELVDYKSKAKKIESNLTSLITNDPKFDPLYFAATYDQLQEIKKQNDFVGLVHEPVKADFSDIFLQNIEKDPFIFAAKESLDSSVGLIGHANKEAASSYSNLLKYMDHEKSIKSKISTRRHFAGFERQYALDFERMNRAAGLKFFVWNHGVNYKNNRDTIRRTVFVRAKNYNSIDDYIKNMDETSKVSKALKYGGRIVFTADIIQSGLSIKNVYETGDIDATRKEIIKQTGKVEGGLIGAHLGARVGTMLGGVVVGVTVAVGGTVGLPVLAVVGVIAVGSTLIGGYFGGVAGSSIAEYSYERLK